MRTDYKDSDNGEQLRMCSVTGVWNEGKMSPGGRDMVTSVDEREERLPGLMTNGDSVEIEGPKLHISGHLHLC